jgi:CubicO group peptidase (beta-lactamase class C family)
LEGLGVSSLMNPAIAGNPGSQGTFGWGGAATASVVIDPRKDLVVLYFTQLMPSDSSFRRFQTLVYQAVVE